jgi:heterodisulfide reductase subunit C
MSYSASGSEQKASHVHEIVNLLRNKATKKGWMHAPHLVAHRELEKRTVRTNLISDS